MTTVSESGYGLLETLGHIDFQNPDSGEFFIGSENPGVAPVNSWFAIFGQFFDHGLDKIGSGGQSTKITIALDPSDPLYRAPGTNGPGDLGNTSIKVSRATVAGADPNGDPNYVNHTSPFIDQSQTYGSVDQITEVLREWVSTDGGGTYHAGMELFDGQTLVDGWTQKTPVYNPVTGLTEIASNVVHNTLPTLDELRAHVLQTGRAALNWDDVLDLRNRDASGQLLDSDTATAGAQTTSSGHALLLDMNPHFDDATVSGGHMDQAKVQSAVQSVTGFETAAVSLTFTNGMLSSITIDNTASGGTTETLDLFKTPAPGSTGLVDVTNFSIVGTNSPAMQAAANEILLKSVGDHYVAGDGRVNENFGLTSIHHVFHEEHNFQVENLKSWIYQHDANNSPLDHAGLHAWQVDTGTQDTNGNFTYGVGGDIAWDADKMFNGAKLIVEMEYQHAAVDQYARTVTPRIQEFVGYSTGVDSTISLEFSQAAFRFGHSTIRETIDTIDPTGWMLGNVTKYALEKAFLAPQTYAEEGVAAITLGLSRQQMNEVDEFITPALTQGLLDLPLDLAAINIARGRDLGIPTLNDFRAAIGLAEYTSWTDYGAGMIHPESLVNFIAAYSFGGGADGVEKAQYILDLADGLPVGANPFADPVTDSDAIAFLINNDGANAELNAARTGFDHINSWIGGLAEAHVPGGLLGETFDAVFVAQIQSLMDGDRFYYLYRLFGTQIHEEVNNGQFKDIVERNTGLEHLNGSIFAYADKYYDFTRDADLNTAGVQDNFAEHAYASLTAPVTGLGIFSDGGASTANNGTVITVDGQQYIRDIRPELDPTQVHTVEGTPTSGADSHEVIVATDNNDFIHARAGDDTVYGEGGNDIIYGDGGVDRLYGGNGDDYIDTGEGPDLADGGAGKDTIYGRGSGSEVGGFDQLVGGSGNDLIVGGEGIDKLSGGSGDDIIYGDGLANPEMGNTDAFTHGGDGNDYIDTGASGDLIFAEEGDDYLVGGQDQDLMQGGQGDDILRPGAPSQASGTVGGPDEVIGDNGQANEFGFDLIDLSDWAGNAPGTEINFATQFNPLVAIDQNTPFPAWFQIEGAIGTSNNDTFIGSDALNAAELPNPFGGSNWLIGGSGSDLFSGMGGNDLIVGGSIRLDTLIGTYAGADFGNLALGSAEWLADAMQTGGTGTGYANNTEDGYTGASNRATGAIQNNGLLDNAALGTGMFDKHFTDMLQSRMFKDVKLGDGGTDGTADTVKFTGNLAEYTIEVIDFTAASGAIVQALKVTDHGGLVDDGTGVLVARAEDGIDLIVGVEQAIFADQTISLIPTPPALDLNADHVVTTTTTVTQAYRDTFNTSSFTNSNGNGAPWTNAWSETGDNNAPGSGQIQIDAGGGGGTNQLRLLDNGDGASIQRTLDLTGRTTATLSFDYSENSFDGNPENVVASFSFNGGTTWHVLPLTLNSGTNGGGNYSVELSNLLGLGESFGANNIVKFEAFTSNGGDGYIAIDNLNVSTTVTTTTNVAGTPGSGDATTFTENGARVAIASFPAIADDSATMASAKVVLTDAIAGDTLRIGNSNATSGTISIPGPDIAYAIDTSVAGVITLTFSGTATRAQYQSAIEQVRYFSTSENPTANDTDTARTIHVTVNDGLWTSNTATAAVTVAAIEDPFVATPDRIVTNIVNTNFVVPEWVLLANDGDPDTVVVPDITAVTESSSGFTASLVASGVQINDQDGSNNSFTYTANFGTTANVAVVRDTNNVAGGNGNDILVGDGGDHTFDAGEGNDFVFAGDGNDTIVWNVTNGGTTDGRDFVDGQGSTAPVGDRFVVNGNNDAETFNIYTAAAAATAGLSGFNINTEIVVTRNGVIIAELDNIEEITVNTFDVTANNGGGLTGGTNGGDTVAVFGDFTTTSLNYSTITINGGDGDDTVNISGLTSDHRVVFNAGAGNDVWVGGQRSQDVFNQDATGDTGNTGGGDDNGHDDDDTLVGTGRAESLNGGTGEDTIKGMGGNDKLDGGTGNDRVDGNAGNDRMSGGAGDDALRGGSGNDNISGGADNDTINGGAGNDRMSGGTGNDKFVFTKGFGNDVINDFDANPAGGQDKLDISALGISASNFASHVLIFDVGADTLVVVDGDTIRLAGVGNSNTVTHSDFVLFGG